MVLGVVIYTIYTRIIKSSMEEKMAQVRQITLIDRERERLSIAARRWGFSDERTLRQSELVDRLINDFMQQQLNEMLACKDKDA